MIQAYGVCNLFIFFVVVIILLAQITVDKYNKFFYRLIKWKYHNLNMFYC